ncbi:Aldehyde Dehydrogenase [Pseudarthrobacter chlorophenolicus A6]|uniref:Aldehyde Dehydrogenase n=1 Tax=Pseudarthrobacter chlorophenolicus (strain ATCC 700700 / DSM 12829 / CIP 107037 / JCM 12360 / KCTC 9906 / NCIMB 13794 / A6) TaxID=452863 RepID=B8H8G8_PSECP|nr:aldehyde dehydrogenase family protein [Pseudarthrobacter chlorophenolicus]ACL38142.1 Aldehyde Dehydrogenase [Pseudarthrobacter chlorophenolicus A6]SDQ54544.1 succinate-semialdehyde dehydrogenase / glutarate-semialdehyde dehydrogenase [Pseudarthrobacter chlorophenolicus]
MSAFAVIDPATGTIHAEYPAATDAEVEAGLAAAQNTYHEWSRTTTVAERAGMARRLAELFVERKDKLAAIINREMGKPLQQAAGEAEFSGSIASAFAENAEEWLADEQLEVADGLRSFFRYQGLGVILGIMPWNYPYYQVARFAIPNIILGNTVIVRHASQCPESALALEELFRDAGFPEGAYVNLFATHQQISNIIADDRVQGVSLTGSEQVGAIVAEQAGRALKKCVLELGGADVFLVLDTDDVDLAVKKAVMGRMGNTGQSCNGSKRIVVLDKYFDEFSEKFKAAIAGQSYENGDFGPMSSDSATKFLASQVQGALDQGAEILVGNNQPQGNVFTPTIITNITPSMDVYSEELFGPVAQLYKVSSDAEAINLANSSPYGLGSVVICDDVERAERVGNQLDVGMVFVGAYDLSGADVPFGGVKKSGYGRELGKVGMLEFANKKLFRFAK